MSSPLRSSSVRRANVGGGSKITQLQFAPLIAEDGIGSRLRISIVPCANQAPLGATGREYFTKYGLGLTFTSFACQGRRAITRPLPLGSMRKRTSAVSGRRPLPEQLYRSPDPLSRLVSSRLRAAPVCEHQARPPGGAPGWAPGWAAHEPYFTSVTGTCTRCSTRLATEPMRTLAMALIPRDPMTTASQ